MSEEWILKGFRKYLQSEGESDVNQSVFDRWSDHLSGLSANTRRSRQLVLRKLCLYRQRNNPDCFVPDPLYFARKQPYRSPVLIEPVQAADLMAQASTLKPSANSPLRGPALRLAIVLLFTAGVRRGELVRFTLDDVDEINGVLRVNESKFHKSRLVPLSASALQELLRYMRCRLKEDAPQSPSSALLCTRSNGWRPYSGGGLAHAIGQLIDAVGVRDSYGRRPRVHDFRHSFAVQALIRLYREKADVQSALPHLSLYMGHVSIVSTAYYLHFIPTLASLASEQFEQHFGSVLDGVEQ